MSVTPPEPLRLEIVLEAGRSRYRAGEEVAGQVRTHATETVRPRELLVRLWWTAEGGQEWSDVTEVVATDVLRRDEHLYPGEQRFPFRVRLPLAPLSTTAKPLVIRWALTARAVWGDGRRDTWAVADLEVSAGVLPVPPGGDAPNDGDGDDDDGRDRDRGGPYRAHALVVGHDVHPVCELGEVADVRARLGAAASLVDAAPAPLTVATPRPWPLELLVLVGKLAVTAIPAAITVVAAYGAVHEDGAIAVAGLLFGVFPLIAAATWVWTSVVALVRRAHGALEVEFGQVAPFVALGESPELRCRVRATRRRPITAIEWEVGYQVAVRHRHTRRVRGKSTTTYKWIWEHVYLRRGTVAPATPGQWAEFPLGAPIPSDAPPSFRAEGRVLEWGARVWVTSLGERRYWKQAFVVLPLVVADAATNLVAGGGAAPGEERP